MEQFISPLALTTEQRKANLAALNARMARASAKLAVDKTQTRATRSNAAKINATARRIAKS